MALPNSIEKALMIKSTTIMLRFKTETLFKQDQLVLIKNCHNVVHASWTENVAIVDRLKWVDAETFIPRQKKDVRW